MSDNPNSLVSQLASRTKTFLSASNLSQKELARLLKVDKAGLSRFLSGQQNLSPEATLQLVRLMSLSKRDLALKFSQPDLTRSRIMSLQIRGEPVQFSNDGWVAKEGGDWGKDPVDSTTIGNTATARQRDSANDYQDQIIDFLKDQQQIHQKAIDLIQGYLDKQAPKAKVNKSGSTETPRKIDDNTVSRTPGPRGDRFSRR